MSSLAEANMSRDYATPDLNQLSPLVVSLPPSPVYLSTSTPSSTPHHHHGHDHRSPLPLPPPHGHMMAGHVTNIQSWSGNSMYALPNSDVDRKEDRNVAEFPRHVLKFVEKLGQGQFGEVRSFGLIARVVGIQLVDELLCRRPQQNMMEREKGGEGEIFLCQNKKPDGVIDNL